MSIPRPELDTELSARLAGMPLGTTLDADILAQMRQYKMPDCSIVRWTSSVFLQV